MSQKKVSGILEHPEIFLTTSFKSTLHIITLVISVYIVTVAGIQKKPVGICSLYTNKVTINTINHLFTVQNNLEISPDAAQKKRKQLRSYLYLKHLQPMLLYFQYIMYELSHLHFQTCSFQTLCSFHPKQKCRLIAKTSNICLSDNHSYILLKLTKEEVLSDEELVSSKSILFYLIDTGRFNRKV